MGNIGSRLYALEEHERQAAVAELHAVLARATDAALARVVYLHRARRNEESNALFESLGFTELLAERAIGGKPDDIDPELLERRFREVHADLLSEPRRSAIKREMAKLNMEGE
jgi:L-amino acid N-acyltransferase YncA